MATSWREDNYRVRNDDGSESAATWIDAVDTAVTIDVYSGDVKFRIRASVSEQGSTGAALTPNLYIQKNGTGGYAQITTSRTDVKPSSSSYVNDGTATTRQLNSLTFVAATVDTVDAKCATTGTIARYSSTEAEYNLIALSAGITSGDYFDFRIYNGTSALNTYTVTPRVTFTKTPPPVTLTVQNASQTQPVDNIGITAHDPPLGVNSSTQSQTSGEIALTQHHVLSVDNSGQLQTSDTITLTGHVPTWTLTTQDCAQIQTSTHISLTPGGVGVVKQMMHYIKLRSK